MMCVYPLIFFAIIFFAERVLASRFYTGAAIVAALPVVFSLFAVVELFVI